MKSIMIEIEQSSFVCNFEGECFVKHQHFDRHTNPLENEIYKTQRSGRHKNPAKRAKSLSAESQRCASLRNLKSKQNKKKEIYMCTAKVKKIALKIPLKIALKCP